MIDLKTDIEEEVMEDGKRQQSRTSGFLKFLVNFSFTCRLVHFQGKPRRKIDFKSCPFSEMLLSLSTCLFHLFTITSISEFRGTPGHKTNLEF